MCHKFKIIVCCSPPLVNLDQHQRHVEDCSWILSGRADGRNLRLEMSLVGCIETSGPVYELLTVICGLVHPDCTTESQSLPWGPFPPSS